MATEIRLPDAGEGVEDVTVSRWRMAVGDTVKAGDILLEVATDKVDTEIPAPASGVLLKINYRAGELAPISAVIGYIGEAGETASPAPPPAETEIRATPVAKRVAADKGVDLAGVSGSGPGGQITKQDVLSHREAPPSPADVALPGELTDTASLVVRRLAADHNLHLREVAGNRPLSTLTKYDVLSALASRTQGRSVRVEPAYAPAPAAPAAPAAPETPTESRPAESQPTAESRPTAAESKPAPREIPKEAEKPVTPIRRADLDARRAELLQQAAANGVNAGMLLFETLPLSGRRVYLPAAGADEKARTLAIELTSLLDLYQYATE